MGELAAAGYRLDVHFFFKDDGFIAGLVDAVLLYWQTVARAGWGHRAATSSDRTSASCSFPTGRRSPSTRAASR